MSAIICFAAALAVLVMPGCSQKSAEDSKSLYLGTANGPVEFEFPAGWYENPDDHPFDLQCFSKFQRTNTGVFLFTPEDLGEEFQPRGILADQIEDMASKRSSWEVVEKEKVVSSPGMTLTTVVFAGEKGSKRYYYRFTLIEFDQNPGLVPVVLQVALPSYWSEIKPVLEAITASARVSS
jgi:hypothetical protein